MFGIYSTRVFINQKLQPATIEIQDGKIYNIHFNERLAFAKDYGDLVIMPGVIDAHVHINEPGRTTCCLLYTSPSPRDS